MRRAKHPLVLLPTRTDAPLRSVPDCERSPSLDEVADRRSCVKLAEDSDSHPVNDGLDVPAEIARREQRLVVAAFRPGSLLGTALRREGQAHRQALPAHKHLWQWPVQVARRAIDRAEDSRGPGAISRDTEPGRCAGVRRFWHPKPCTARYMVATWGPEATKPSGCGWAKSLIYLVAWGGIEGLAARRANPQVWVVE